MDLKPFWQSKTVWMNFVLSLIGILTLVADYLGQPSLIVTSSGVIMVLVGALGVILRIWFTDQPISTPARVADAAYKAELTNGGE